MTVIFQGAGNFSKKMTVIFQGAGNFLIIKSRISITAQNYQNHSTSQAKPTQKITPLISNFLPQKQLGLRFDDVQRAVLFPGPRKTAKC
jgi:hypothetical protein